MLPPKERLAVEIFGEPLTFEFLRELELRDATFKPTLAHAYVGMGYTLLISIDNTIHGRLLHFSLSSPQELPPWDLITGIKRRLFPPDVAAVMHLPEEASYVNVHEYCLHVWQLPVKWDTQ